MPIVAKPFTFSNSPPNTNPIDADQVNSDFDVLYGLVNGNLDADNMDAGFLSEVGPGIGRRGKSVVATEETWSSNSYGLLGTPDRVQSLVLPTDGLLLVAFEAMWKGSVSQGSAPGNSRAAIFIGTNQLKVQTVNLAAPQTSAAVTAAESTGAYSLLHSCPVGLVDIPNSSGNDVAPVTTGQALGSVNYASGIPTRVELGGSVATDPSAAGAIGGGLPGGFCVIRLAAATYDVSVRFKATSGTVTAKNRKLLCWTVGFG